MQPFEEVVAEHGAVVLRVCRALVGPADADDAWSETFLAALRSYPDLRPDSNVRAWLVTIAHRKAIDQLRGISRRATPTSDLPEAGEPDARSEPPDAGLVAALAALPPKQRAAVTYHHVAGLSYAEVGALIRDQRSRRPPQCGRRHRQPAQDLRERNDPMIASTTTSDDELFSELGLPSEDDTARLHARLVDRAGTEGLLDVAYRTVDTPYGSLLLAATPQGLVRLAFEGEDHDAVLARLAGTVSPRILRSGRGTDDAARQLDEYFDHRRRVFDVPVDLRLAHGFRRDVLAHLQGIAYGRTESYASVAAATGHPKAVRAVGGACSHNPVPIIVPCHRVVRSDGTIGHYLGGTEMKVALLAMEAA